MRDHWSALRSLKRFMAQALGDAWEVRIADEPGTQAWPYCRVTRVSSGATATGRASLTEHTQPFAISAYKGPADSDEEALQAAHRVEDVMVVAFRYGAATLPAPAGMTATAAAGGTLPAGTYSYVVSAVTRQGGEAVSDAVQITTPTVGSVTLAWTGIPAATSYRIYRGVPGDERVIAVSGDPFYLDTGLTAVGGGRPSSRPALTGAPMRVPFYDYDALSLSDPAPDETRRYHPSDYLEVIDLSTTVLPDPADARNVAAVANLRCRWRRSFEDLLPDDHTLTDVRLRFLTG